MIMKVMERFPVFITLGAGLLGYVAGEMAVADPSIKGYIETNAHYLDTVIPIAGALSVVIAGKLIERRNKRELAVAGVSDQESKPIKAS
jgi:predicted tellurium resistance membrane protein TerC